MVHTRSETIKTESGEGGGRISVMGEGSESSADVYVQTSQYGVSLSRTEAFELIELVAKGAGLWMNENGHGGLTIQKPENPVVAKRRNDLAKEFDQTGFDNCYTGLKNAINYIVDGELEAGVLK